MIIPINLALKVTLLEFNAGLLLRLTYSYYNLQYSYWNQYVLNQLQNNFSFLYRDSFRQIIIFD